MYGCAAVSNASNWSYDGLIFLNLLVMAVCYTLVLVKVMVMVMVMVMVTVVC